MKKIFILGFITFICVHGYTQSPDEIYTVTETMPEYPGGEEAMYSFIQKNVKYPSMAKETGIQGKVYVQFVIRKDGSVTNIEVIKGIGGGCDEEAIRVVKLFPKWKPGEQGGKPVDVRMRLPFSFKLY